MEKKLEPRQQVVLIKKSAACVGEWLVKYQTAYDAQPPHDTTGL
jgi:hypothetical protein